MVHDPQFVSVPNAPQQIRGAWLYPRNAQGYAVLLNREEAEADNTWSYTAVTCADGWSRILISDDDGEPLGWL